MRNMHVALMCSQGTPMIHMGDEYGHTRFGNNNSYGHDNALNHFLWSVLANGTGEDGDDTKGFFRFYSSMIRFRHNNGHILGRTHFLEHGDVSWHGDDWSNDESRYIGMLLHNHGDSSGSDIFVAFNSHEFALDLTLPTPPGGGGGRSWHRIVDTQLATPDDFCDAGVRLTSLKYAMAPFSSIVLRAGDEI